MKLEFFTNAAMRIVAADGIKILCDPWFTPGAFDGSWWHYPPLETRPETVGDYTHLYVSHIHPDHCDLASLRRLPNKYVPVIILKREGEIFLRERIRSCGFDNFIEISDKGRREVAPGVFVTMYEAFSPSVFMANAETPNVIDSSIVVESEGHVIFNANDNIPSPDDCTAIRERHGEIDLALLPYCGVGPYPSSYTQLSLAERAARAQEKARKYLERLVENARALQPKMVVPCAGQMILGGKQAWKNRFLGCAEPQDAARELERAGILHEVLWEQDVYDTVSRQVERGGFGPMGKRGLVKSEYIKVIQGERYWWEDAFTVPGDQFIELLRLLNPARKRLAQYQRRYPYNEKANDWYIAISVDEIPEVVYVFKFAPDSVVEKKVKKDFVESGEPFLMITIPYNYLIAILTLHGHWNNAYHGCHVNWWRNPDVYLPDMQMLLSYFHL